MKKRTSFKLSCGIAAMAACALFVALASAILPKAAADEGSTQVLGMAFDGHSVSNLEKSIAFYKVLDFKVVQKPTGWKVDKSLNKLEGLPAGTQSRTAVLATQSSVSSTPYDLVLHQYKGIDQKDWSKLDSGALGAGHMDLTVMDDCNIVVNKLKSAGLLVLPEMGAFSRAPASGPRPFVFVQDPDGWYIELFAIINPKPGVRVDEGKISNSSATMADINRLGYQTGFNHIGLNVSDAAKERSFYEDVLGGDYPPITPPGTSGIGRGMTMLNGWFNQATTNGKVRLEILGAAANAGKPSPGQKLSDTNVNYVGFEVTNIDDVYSKAKAAGATDVTEGGIMKVKDGRAVMLLDPNGVGYVELWQSSKPLAPFQGH
ncbi:MAG: VOC family protein [Acidobacteriota bacterium]|nr:VOC family protein [Acidobacteriota bacterium]